MRWSTARCYRGYDLKMFMSATLPGGTYVDNFTRLFPWTFGWVRTYLPRAHAVADVVPSAIRTDRSSRQLQAMRPFRSQPAVDGGWAGQN